MQNSNYCFLAGLRHRSGEPLFGTVETNLAKLSRLEPIGVCSKLPRCDWAEDPEGNFRFCRHNAFNQLLASPNDQFPRVTKAHLIAGGRIENRKTTKQMWPRCQLLLFCPTATKRILVMPARLPSEIGSGIARNLPEASSALSPFISEH
jgi:hypothetical protein